MENKQDVVGLEEIDCTIKAVYIMCHVYGKVSFRAENPQSGLGVRKCCVSLISDSQSDR